MNAIPLTDALLWLGRWLQGEGYRFTTVTPATHARADAREDARTARTLRDIFGWSRPFSPDLLTPHAAGWLSGGGLLEAVDSAPAPQPWQQGYKIFCRRLARDKTQPVQRF